VGTSSCGDGVNRGTPLTLGGYDGGNRRKAPTAEKMRGGEWSLSGSYSGPGNTREEPRVHVSLPEHPQDEKDSSRGKRGVVRENGTYWGRKKLREDGGVDLPTFSFIREKNSRSEEGEFLSAKARKRL